MGGLLKNMPIMGKFLAIIGVFGVFTIGVAVYATGQMRAIDTAYSNLIDHDDQAAVYMVRANRATNAAHAAIGDLLIATTDADNKAALDMLAASRADIETYIGKAEAALPANTKFAELKAAAFKVIDEDCATSIRAGRAAVTAEAVAASQRDFLRQCAAKFPPVIKAFRENNDTIIAEAKRQNDALTVTTNHTIQTTYTVILGGLALVVALAFFVIRGLVTSPLGVLNATMQRLAGGDNAVEIAGGDRKDEIGSMAKTVQVFKSAAIEKVRVEADAEAQRNTADGQRKLSEAERLKRADELAKVVQGLAGGLSKLSEGDLTHRLSTAFAEEYESLRRDFNAAMEKLLETMKVVSNNAGAIHSGSGEISTAADDLSRRTEQQAASLEETAAALDQITATVRKTADGALHARDVVGAAKGDAERSGAIVREAVGAMSGIEKSSTQISQIIGVIDEIAFQTNLLALNAGVEAARAGDAGRGFAVVASEVRALAQRSAEAAKEIKTLISASGQQVASGVDLVGEAGRALERIVTQVTEINTVVGGIAASAQEQATALNQVNTAVNQMDQVTQQNAAMVEQTTAASHSLAHEAQELSRLITRFDVGQAAAGEAPRRASPPRPATAPAPPRATPAMKTVGTGGAARKPQAAAQEESWEEF